MTKEEFYKELIGIQKKSGQGLSGIVRVMGIDSGNFCIWLDELIEEGLVKACDTGGSLGHPESNIFYMPTKGYNVWEDEGTDGQYNRYKGRYLHFVRLYLGAWEGEESDTIFDYIRNPELMSEYSEWLKRNGKALQEMINLDDFYKSVDIKFSEEELKWIKSREWYKENKTIEKCFKSSKSAISDDEEAVSLNKQLIKLYDRSMSLSWSALGETKHQPALDKAHAEIAEIGRNVSTRKKLHNWFEKQDNKSKIQDII